MKSKFSWLSITVSLITIAVCLFTLTVQSTHLTAAAQVVQPAMTCVDGLRDSLNRSECITASRTPQLGELHPLSSDFFIDATSGNVGVGTTSPSKKLEVSGGIQSTVGGFWFPDGTVQSSAAIDTGFRLVGEASGSNATITDALTLEEGRLYKLVVQTWGSSTTAQSLALHLDFLHTHYPQPTHAFSTTERLFGQTSETFFGGTTRESIRLIALPLQNGAAFGELFISTRETPIAGNTPLVAQLHGSMCSFDGSDFYASDVKGMFYSSVDAPLTMTVRRLQVGSFNYELKLFELVGN